MYQLASNQIRCRWGPDGSRLMYQLISWSTHLWAIFFSYGFYFFIFCVEELSTLRAEEEKELLRQKHRIVCGCVCDGGTGDSIICVRAYARRMCKQSVIAHPCSRSKKTTTTTTATQSHKLTTMHQSEPSIICVPHIISTIKMWFRDISTQWRSLNRLNGQRA